MPQPESLGRREEDQPAASEAAEEPEAASPETEPDPTPEQRPAKPAGERSGRKRGDRRPPRESKRAESAKPRPEPAPEPDEDEEAEELPLDAGDAPLPATMAGPGESVHEGPEDEIMAESREILENILKLMDVDAQVDSQRIDDRVILNVTGENGGLLIGKKGATLDALQFLVNKIINREHDEKYRVIVDTENYRVRRHQSLIELANRMADKARRTRRPITISQLSAHDRRVVHLALQDKQGLRTRSRGDGPLKNVVIVPQGKRNDRRRSSQGARGGGDQ
jgi:spoIIIJ-associated protein